MKDTDALAEIKAEYETASFKFGIMLSPHEGLAIILEEYEELKEEVFKQFDTRDKLEMRKEAIHLATMAMRFMVDLT